MNMNEEIEVKFLDIDVDDIVRKLESFGATKEFDRMYSRIVYDYPDMRLDKDNAWVRLRDEGDKVTLTFKQRTDVKGNAGDDGGMKELEVVVDDYWKTGEILNAIGLIEKGSQQNRRVRYKWGDVTVDIDYWPLLKPYIEIESDHMEKVKKAAAKLEMIWDEHKIFTTYQMYKNIGINIHEYSEFTFDKQVKR
jgi:adenylate cyclase, class 2